MAQPVLTPSGVFQLRRKVPPELVQVLGREYKRSLKTRDPHEAKVKHAEEWIRSESAFALARAQQGGAEVLAARDIELLASRWYQTELANLERSGDFASWLADGRKSIIEGPDRYEEHVPLVSLREAMADDPELNLSASVEAAMKAAMKQNGIPMPLPETTNHARLVAAFSVHLLQLSDIALRRSEGDWIAKARVLPDEPLSFEIQRTESIREGKRLLKVFEEYAEDKMLTDGDVRSVRKTVESFRATVNQFVELFGNLYVKDVTRDVIRQYRAHIAMWWSNLNGHNDRFFQT